MEVVQEGVQEVGELAPREAFRALRETADSVLVDVRTAAEIAFVGGPDPRGFGRPLVRVEWVGFPDGRPNAGFVEELRAALGAELPRHLYFICRSGSRSLAAARLVAQQTRTDGGGPVACTNVAEGFEGDLDPEGHRGTVNGWKVAGLPWRQS